MMRRFKTCVGLIILLSLQWALAQTVDINRALVAYVNSVSSFVEWPSDKEAFRLYVITDDKGLISQFEEFESNRKLKGRPAEVIISEMTLIPEDVDIVFVSEKFRGDVPLIYDQIFETEILMITYGVKDPNFVMVNIMPGKSGYLEFDVNRENILAQNLTVRNELVLLGGSEVDVIQLYREALDSLRYTDAKISRMQNQYDSLIASISDTRKIIQEQNIDIDEQINEIYEKQYIIDRQSRALYRLEDEVRFSQSKVDSIEKGLLARENELVALQRDIALQSTQLTEGNARLEAQRSLIQQQDEEIKARESRLEEMSTVVDSQKNRMLLLMLFLFAVVIFSIVLFRAYRERQVVANKLTEQKEELSVLVNELHQTQNKLVQSEKMASIGVLTAGIAHEINNAINFIYSGIQIMEMKFTEIRPVIDAIKSLQFKDARLKDKVKKLVEKKEEAGYNESQEVIDRMIESIQIGAERTTEIVKGLRTFSRTDDEELVMVNVHRDLDVALLLLKGRHQSQITIEKKYDERIPDIQGYQGQLGQAFLNIINNAIDAVASKGDQGKITIETSKRRNGIEIKIKDNGPGIQKEIIDRVFDPFFTTKKVGAGTGLGLSITYGIIEKHQGTIGINRERKAGTEFIITLPLDGSERR